MSAITLTYGHGCQEGLLYAGGANVLGL
jgi:hypothetical protein